MKKRVISLILALVLLAGCLPMTAAPADAASGTAYQYLVKFAKQGYHDTLNSYYTAGFYLDEDETTVYAVNYYELTKSVKLCILTSQLVLSIEVPSTLKSPYTVQLNINDEISGTAKLYPATYTEEKKLSFATYSGDTDHKTAAKNLMNQLLPEIVEITGLVLFDGDFQVRDLGFAAFTRHIYHVYDKGKVTQEPTCTEKGVKTYTCQMCGKKQKESIPALGHEFQEGTCTRCGEADPDFVAPEHLDAPTVKATSGAQYGKIKLSWKAVPEAYKYKIYRAESESGPFKLIKTTRETSYQDETAERTKTYFYKVKAVCGPTVSKYSTVVSATYKLSRPQMVRTHVASTGKNKITWKAVSGAVAYKVYRSEKKDGPFVLAKTAAADDLSYVHLSAEAGKSYYYKVIAVSKVEEANSSGKAEILTCDLPRPVIRVKLNENNKPRISWDAVAGAVRYKVYRSRSKTTGYALLGTTTKTSFNNTSAGSKITYYYKVIACGKTSASNSAYSLPVSIKTN